MIIWKQLRIPLLLLTFGSLLLGLGNIILLPTKDQGKVSSFVFPTEVPLPQWQLSLSRPLPQQTGKHSQPLTQKHYQYIQNNQALDIEMRYIRDGNVPVFIKEYTNISSTAIVRQREGVGFYGLGVDQQRAYLSACINPQGSSTFTDEQFNQNRHVNETRPQHLLSWLLGQGLFQDNRCLWAHLSVSLKDSSPKEAYSVLENAWFSWYQWWHLRFPKP